MKRNAQQDNPTRDEQQEKFMSVAPNWRRVQAEAGNHDASSRRIPATSYRPTRRNKRRDALFIDILRAGDSQRDAAIMAGYRPDTVSKWKGKDPEFAQMIEDAREEHTQVLESEAVRRSMPHAEFVKFSKSGEPIYKNVSSDILLMFLLKARRPNVYRDNVKVEVQQEHRITLDLLPVQGGQIVDIPTVAQAIPGEIVPFLPEGNEGNEGQNETIAEKSCGENGGERGERTIARKEVGAGQPPSEAGTINE